MSQHHTASPAKRLARHGRLLAFVGALIVFLTFVVKEELRDHLKGVVDSVEGAKNSFVLRAYLVEIEKESMPKLEEIKPIQDGRTLQDALYMETHLATYDDNAVDNLNALLDVVSHTKDDDDRRIEEIRETLADMKNLLHSAWHTSLNMPSHNDNLQYGVALSQARSQTIHASGQHAIAAGKIALLTKEALDEADTKKQSATRRYLVCTWFSYALYTVGWSLGLIGRVVGTDGIDQGA
jgi:hypothetical protein